jgi:hypothetical protein
MTARRQRRQQNPRRQDRSLDVEGKRNLSVWRVINHHGNLPTRMLKKSASGVLDTREE